MSSQSKSGFRVGPDGDPDRYVLGAAVASGAEGILYRGSITTATGLELDVAIKMLQPRFLSQVDQWHARWSEQVELLRSLQVPGVVRVRDGFMGPLPHSPGEAGDNRTLYLVMNWVDGEPLDEWVRRRADRDPLDALKLLLGVAVALDLMHSGRATGGIPVVHRDVKPSNILVSDEGSVLVDFGLTRGLPEGHRSSGITGTPGYLPPEATESGTYTPATDRYALGGVAYFVLTGAEPPINHDPATIRSTLSAIPALASCPETIELLMAMLQTDPTLRPTSLGNWIGQLRRSSLTSLPDVLAPEAPARNPQRFASPGASRAPMQRVAGGSGRRRQRILPLGAAGAGVIPLITPETPPGIRARSRRSRRSRLTALSVIGAAIALVSLIATEPGRQQRGQIAAPQSPGPTLGEPVDRPAVPPSENGYDSPAAADGIGLVPVDPSPGTEQSPADVAALLPPPVSAPTSEPPPPNTSRAAPPAAARPTPVPSVTAPPTTQPMGTASAVIERFENGTGGWRTIGEALVEYKPTGGNTGGFASATDDPKGTTWYWEAPQRFLGKQSVYGRSLKFDLQQSGTSNNINTWDVFLYGFDGTILVLDLPNNPGTTWTSYSIPLDDRSGWIKVASGRPSASAVDMRGVLDNLKYLRIRGEFEGSPIPDIGGLDNVLLGA